MTSIGEWSGEGKDFHDLGRVRGDREFKDFYHLRRVRGDSREGGSSEQKASDVVDLLPSDPFGMSLIGNSDDSWSDEGGSSIKGDYQFVAGRCVGELGACSGSGSDGDGEAEVSGDSLFYALGYLGVSDLLLAERVCRSFRSAVKSDTLLWRNIHIYHPLNARITDDALVELTRRAQGILQCLSLVECSSITEDGLNRVLESNPKLTKLSVLGCTRIKIDGLVKKLKAFKSPGKTGIKYLRIGGLYGVTQKHYEELKFLLDVDKYQKLKDRKTHLYLYHRDHSSPSFDERPIDIEICPRCQNVRLVYDCPAESCRGKQLPAQLCRACIVCISRCTQCGRCINGNEYIETFCLEVLCSGCCKQQLQCPERLETRYHFHLHG